MAKKVARKIPENVIPSEFLINCNILGRVAKATFSDEYVSGGPWGDYDCYPEYDVEIYLSCECGGTHTWNVR